MTKTGVSRRRPPTNETITQHRDFISSVLNRITALMQLVLELGLKAWAYPPFNDLVLVKLIVQGKPNIRHEK
jgi:hypothetical protein